MLSTLLKSIKRISNCSTRLPVLYKISTDSYSEYEPKQVSLKKGDPTIASIEYIINGCKVSVNPLV